MSASHMDELQQSLKRYKEKKERFRSFIDEAAVAVEKFDAQFPPEARQENAAPASRAKIFHDLSGKIANSRLKILVAGEFKRGKSTLINALLGEEVLPAYSTPCTAVITEILYGAEKRAVLTFKQQIGPLPAGTDPKVVKHVGNRQSNIPDMVVDCADLGNELESYLVIPENEEDKEQSESVAESPYACCRLFWPLELCRNDVEIIDSPGLNEATVRDETTYTYVPQADMVLHVLNATQLFGKADKEFVDKVEKLHAPLFFLVNRFDQLNTERDREQIRSRALKELPARTPYGQDGIFFLSAYKALEARMEHDGDAYTASGFVNFERKLAEVVERDRLRIKFANSMQTACDELHALTDNFIPELRKKLDMDVAALESKYASKQKEFQKLEEKKNRIQQDIQKKFSLVRKNLELESKAFMERFVAEELEECISRQPVEISVFSRKADTEKAGRLLTTAVTSHLQNTFSDFNQTLTENIRQEIEELKETIKYQIEDFDELLDAIRVDMGMNIGGKNLAISARGQEVGLEEFMPDMLGGAIVGGSAGAAAVFVASRFIALLGGPVGWGLTILSTLGAALFALSSNTSAADKFKNEFASAARARMREKIPAFTSEVSANIAGKLEGYEKFFINELETRVQDTKAPIEEAIRQLRSNQDSVETQKQKLDQFKTELAAVLDRGEKLLAEI